MSELVAMVRQLGLEHVQVSLNALLAADEALRESEMRVLLSSGLRITAGMLGFVGEDYSSIASIRKTGGLVPTSKFEERRAAAIEAAKLVRELGATSYSLHVGFIPASSAVDYDAVLNRIGDAVDAVGELGVTLLMETGQETASELLQFLNDLRRKNLLVNFDPANMVLYGAGDPIDAVRILGRHIGHVHLKDATLSDQPRMKWGNEVPFGSGMVRPRRLLDALDAAGYRGPLMIEREAGSDRLRDIQEALDSLKNS